MKGTTSHIGEIFQAILPPDLAGKLLCALSVVMPIILYLGRAYIDDVTAEFIDTNLPAFCFLFCLIALIGIALLLANIVYLVKSNRHPMPLVLFFIGVACGLLLPVPPTAEETFFTSNRTKYEELVEMARDGQLQNSSECSGNDRFEPPAGYESLVGKNECINVGSQTPRLVVEFQSSHPCRSIIYFQDPSMTKMLDSEPCCADGFVFKQLSEHWYIVEWHYCY